MEIIIIALYFVPLIIAMSKDHPQVASIAALNLLLGWTFLFWVLALCWALSNQENKGKVR